MAFDPTLINFLTVGNFTDPTFGVPLSQPLIAAPNTGLSYINSGGGSSYTASTVGNLAHLMGLQTNRSYGVVISVPQADGGLVTRQVQGSSTISITNGDGLTGDPTIGVNPSSSLQLTQIKVNGRNAGSPHSSFNLIAGSNIGLTYTDTGTQTDLTINAFGGGGGGSGTVTSVGLASSTLSVSGSPVTSSGVIDVELRDTAVIPGSYTLADITVDAFGRITAASNGTAPGSGTVTSVNLVSSNLAVTGSPITTSGTITVALGDTGVTSGDYTNANISVDEFGRITSASNGLGPTFATLTTSSTTPANLLTVTVPANGSVTINGFVNATDITNFTDATGGSFNATAVSASGTPSLVGSPIVLVNASTTGIFNVELSGNTLSVQVTAPSNDNYQWNAVFFVNTIL